MCYWDYISIMNSLKLKNDRAMGKAIVRSVPQSNKDMIQREKELHGTS